MFGGSGGFQAESQFMPAHMVPTYSGPAALFQGGTPSTGSSDGDIRTIFVTGFPTNLNERELHNTVCNLPGYEASQINLKPAGGGSPQGFVLFATPATAQAAMQVLNDMPFDTDSRLRVEIAHKNMFIKDDPSIRRANSRRSSPAAAAAAAAGAMLSASTMSGLPAGVSLGPAQGGAYTAAAAGPHAFAGPLLSTLAALRPAGGPHLAPAQLMHGAMPVAGFGPVSNKYDNPPCNTLFIGNLGDNVDEGELLQIFATQPGYKQLKLLRQSRQVSCFVEFLDVASAIAVHQVLQGAIITSSDRGPIRIQYSKNPFGKRSPTSSSSSNVFGAAGASALAASMHHMPNVMGEFGWPGSFTLG